jgi:membrane protease YdiL (CAAX protease family)
MPLTALTAQMPQTVQTAAQLALTAAPGAAAAALLRLLGPMVAAGAAAWTLDWMCRKKGLQPPGFDTAWRRTAAFLVVAAILWIGVFSPLGEVGRDTHLDLTHISTPQLFLLHVLLAAAILAWLLLGFAGVGGRPGTPADAAAPAAAMPTASAVPDLPEMPGIQEVAGVPDPAAVTAVTAVTPSPPPPPHLGRQLAAQLGLTAGNVPREVGIGLLLGFGAWAVVLLALFAVAIAVYAMGGDKALPKPSMIVPWIAGLPIAVRVLVSLSAGVVEETFFRGFLQPRVGILLSTACFALAHVSYGQPFMLLGVTLLSLIFALLVRWRQTIWPAIAAHALFDGIQLLVIIPVAVKLMNAHLPGVALTALSALAAAAQAAGAAPTAIW